jgi:hypothetical protein
LHNLGDFQAKDAKNIEFKYQVNKKPRPFKAYVKEISSFGTAVKDMGEMIVMTDGYNEVNARLT